jgi:hypothetical protein
MLSLSEVLHQVTQDGEKRSDEEDSIESEKRFQEKNMEDSDLFLLLGVRVHAVDFDDRRTLGEVRSDDDLQGGRVR